MYLRALYIQVSGTCTMHFTVYMCVCYTCACTIRTCIRSGLKPGQRKVLFTCFKRNDKREIKVAQLAGSVAEHSAYHHGEVHFTSLLAPYTLSSLAQQCFDTCTFVHLCVSESQ